MAPSDTPKSVLFFGHGEHAATPAGRPPVQRHAALKRQQSAVHERASTLTPTLGPHEHQQSSPHRQQSHDAASITAAASAGNGGAATSASTSTLHAGQRYTQQHQHQHHRRARLAAAAAETLDLLPAPGTVNDIKFARATWKQFMTTLKPIGLTVLLNGFCRAMRHDAHTVNNHVAAATTVMKVGFGFGGLLCVFFYI